MDGWLRYLDSDVVTLRLRSDVTDISTNSNNGHGHNSEGPMVMVIIAMYPLITDRARDVFTL
jgi:hypothetical protein